MTASLIFIAGPLALCFIFGAVELAKVVANVRGDQNFRGRQ